MQIEPGGRIRCLFRNAGSGLESWGGELRHFAVAGRDRIFHWADAGIEGETVVGGGLRGHKVKGADGH
jgi:sialate O-acetylesterase